MKRMSQTSTLTELFVKAGLIAALATVLLAPLTIRAEGGEAAQAGVPASPAVNRASWSQLPLPPIPHLETMPWLVKERSKNSFKIDTLLSPAVEAIGPSMAGGDEQPSDRARNG